MPGLLSSFIKPRRRLVRQRSGFKVNGTKSGSECAIFQPTKVLVKEGKFKLTFSENGVKFLHLFSEFLCMYGMGGYIKPSKKAVVSVSMNITHTDKLIESQTCKVLVPAKTWGRFGCDIQSIHLDPKRAYDVKLVIEVSSSDKEFEVELFGLQAGAVDYYVNKQTEKTSFYQKTNIYKPEIYYLPFRRDKDFTIKGKCKMAPRSFLIGKSCNRCGRYLPIDIENEPNSLGYSNHCTKSAPCTHSAFSRYEIENPENTTLISKSLQKNVVLQEGKKYLKTHFGFQLECRTCKKFVVNAPLNPLRNKAQHHEDGARRRAFERLIIELTKEDFVKNYRVTHGQEFQDYIWEKFGKQCFFCEDPIKFASDMNIDHTLPLAYLWPLDDTATALCATCNSKKHDLFPSDFYNEEQLEKLSKLTSIPLATLSSKKKVVNPKVINLLIKNTVWLFDDFLSQKDYQKNKKGKKVADLVYKALQKVLTPNGIDLLTLYFEETGKYPQTITLSKELSIGA